MNDLIIVILSSPASTDKKRTSKLLFAGTASAVLLLLAFACMAPSLHSGGAFPLKLVFQTEQKQFFKMLFKGEISIWCLSSLQPSKDSPLCNIVEVAKETSTSSSLPGETICHPFLPCPKSF